MTLSRTAKWLLSLLLFMVPTLTFAQGGQYTLIISSPEPLPNCDPSTGNQRQPIIWDATINNVVTCIAHNTWSSIGGGGGGGGTPGSPLNSIQANVSGTFVGVPLGTSGAPLISNGTGTPATFQAINLAGGSSILTGILPVANLPSTSVNVVVNDTNVTGSIATQTLTLGWTGTLSKARTLATTVYTDQSNTYSAGPQTFPGGDFFAGGVNAQTGTTYTFVASDINKLVTFNNSGATGAGLPRATTAGFTAGAIIYVFNIGTGAVTITPTTSTVNGNSSMVFNQNQGGFIESDGTNYAVWQSAAPSGSGTVTSAGLQVNSGSSSGIFTVTGSPITTSGNLNVTLSGTSGGLAYFSSGTVLSSSTAPAANGVVLWGGTGTAPTSTAADTTVTDVLHATNPRAFGPIVNADVAAVTWAALATGTATSIATFPGGDFFMGGINEQTGTTYNFVASDEHKLVTLNNASGVSGIFPQATTSGFGTGAIFYVFNEGSGAAIITTTTSTINDQTSLPLPTNTGAIIFSDGTNYSALIGGSGSFVNPMTTLGDIIYENSTPAAARLAGPTAPTGINQTLCSSPSSGIAAAPQWCIPGVQIDAQTGTSYNIPITDDVAFLTGNNSAATSWTGFTLANNYVFSFENLGAGLITYTPASGTVNGAATQIIPQNWFGFHYTNNTNTFMPVMPTIAAWPNCPTGAIEFTATTGVISCGASSSFWSGIAAGANTATGAFSTAGPWTFSAAGVASTPAMSITGTPFSGTGTTSIPQLYFNTAVSQPSTWSTSGTFIGWNAPGGCGNIWDAHVNGGVSLAKLACSGALTLSSAIVANTANITNTLTMTEGSHNSTQVYTATGCEISNAATTLSTGSTTTSTGVACLPANSIIDAIVYRITTAITSATSFTIGDGTIAGRFCGTQTTLTIGATGVCFVQADQTGTSGPRQVSAASVVVTTNSNPGAGVIRLIVFSHTWTAPTS